MYNIIEVLEAQRLEMVSYYNKLSPEDKDAFYSRFIANEKAFNDLIRSLQSAMEELKNAQP